MLRRAGTLLLSTPAHGRLGARALALSRAASPSTSTPAASTALLHPRDARRLLEDFGFEAIDVRARAGLPGARRLLLARAVRSRF